MSSVFSVLILKWPGFTLWFSLDQPDGVLLIPCTVEAVLYSPNRIRHPEALPVNISFRISISISFKFGYDENRVYLCKADQATLLRNVAEHFHCSRKLLHKGLVGPTIPGQIRISIKLEKRESLLPTWSSQRAGGWCIARRLTWQGPVSPPTLNTVLMMMVMKKSDMLKKLKVPIMIETHLPSTSSFITTELGRFFVNLRL